MSWPTMGGSTTRKYKSRKTKEQVKAQKSKDAARERVKAYIKASKMTNRRSGT